MEYRTASPAVCPGPGEQLDDLQNGYHLIQAKNGFRFGVDAVLLADYAKERIGRCVLDLCCGNGIVPVLLAAKTACPSICGLEIQAESASLAKRNVRLNGLEERIRIVEGDLKESTAFFAPASFSSVTCNPPYMIGTHGLHNPDSAAAIARHELLCTFEDIAANASKLLEHHGRFYLVHRPFRLPELMTTLIRHRLEPKRMRLVYPMIDREPSMVLLECVKGGRARMTVDPPLFIYETPGVYTREILDIYGKTAEPERR